MIQINLEVKLIIHWAFKMLLMILIIRDKTKILFTQDKIKEEVRINLKKLHHIINKAI